MSSDRLASFLGRAADVRADFGARADGNHDDRPNIQEALLEASRAGGGLVYVPPGTYKLGSALSFTGLNSVTLWIDVSATGAGSALPASGAYGTNVVFRMGDAASGTVPVGSVGGSGGSGNGEITPGTVSGGGTTGGGDVTPGTVAGSGDNGAGDITVGTITGSGDAGDTGAGSATASGDLTGGSVSLADLTATLRRLLGFSRGLTLAGAGAGEDLRLSIDGGALTPVGRWLDLVQGSGVTLTLTGHQLTLAASGSGALVKIAEHVIATTLDRTETLRFPAAGPLPTSYRHLLLFGQARTLRTDAFPAGADSNLWIAFNDDLHDGTGGSNGNYSWEWHEHDGDNSVHDAQFTNLDQGIMLGNVAANDSPAGYATSYRVDLPNYGGAAFLAGLTFQAIEPYANTASRRGYEGGGYQRLVRAVTSLDVFTNLNYVFDVGTVWTLYGVS